MLQSDDNPYARASRASAATRLVGYLFKRAKLAVPDKTYYPAWVAYAQYVGPHDGTLVTDIQDFSIPVYQQAKAHVSAQQILTEDKALLEECKKTLSSLLDLTNPEGNVLMNLVDKMQARLADESPILARELTKYCHLVGYVMTIFNGHWPQSVRVMDMSDWGNIRYFSPYGIQIQIGAIHAKSLKVQEKHVFLIFPCIVRDLGSLYLRYYY